MKGRIQDSSTRNRPGTNSPKGGFMRYVLFILLTVALAPVSALVAVFGSILAIVVGCRIFGIDAFDPNNAYWMWGLPAGLGGYGVCDSESRPKAQATDERFSREMKWKNDHHG